MTQESFLVARPTDVEAMLLGARKRFIGHMAKYGTSDNYTSTRPDDLRAVVFYILITSDEVDEDGDMEFLSGLPTTPSSGVGPYCCQGVGFLIPEVSTSDLITGRNTDCHVNPDNSIHIDNLQLTRALINAATYYFQEKMQTNLFTQVLHTSEKAQIKTELGHTRLEEMSAGVTSLLLSIKLPKTILTELVRQHDRENPASLVKFSLITLNQAGYPIPTRTLN